MSSQVIEAIRQNSEIVIQFLKDHQAPSGYQLEALQWLENYLEEQRSTFTQQNRDNLVLTIGSFLGECLCHVYDGIWTEVDGRWGVQMGAYRLTAFPFSKVSKFIEQDATDSFVGMFRSIPGLIKHVSHNQTEDRGSE